MHPPAADRHRPPPLPPPYAWRDRAVKPALFYATHHSDADALLARLPHGPVGFDLEWRPNRHKGQPQNPVALVQLATANVVLLLHVHLMTQFPRQLAELLSSPSWIKAGVSIQHDCAKLYHDYGLSVRNCVDLSLLARSVDNARWKGHYTNPIGLARLLASYEHATLSKGRVRLSNWEQLLNKSQQDYAANDAHAGYTVYSRLVNMTQATCPVPLPTYYTFSFINGQPRDRFGIAPWHAHNPYYDPGLPPPPKPKDADKDNQERPDTVIESEPQHAT